MDSKIFVFGRHDIDLGDTPGEIIGAESKFYSLVPSEVDAQLEEMVQAARAAGADTIVFQNLPAVLVGAMRRRNFQFSGLKVAAVVSFQDKTTRQAGVVREFVLFSGWVARRAAEAIKFANGRAKTTVNGNRLTVEVDPVPAFKFSHLEWLNK